MILLNFGNFVHYVKIMCRMRKDNKKNQPRPTGKYKPVVLIILDGLGVPQEKTMSPWWTAVRPSFSEIEKNFPFTTLQASGIAVGLPWGEAGNSEVGHLTIGAGKIIYNYLPHISRAIKDGSFEQNNAFLKAIGHVKENNSDLHLLGLFSTGTVHTYLEHFYALLELAAKNKVKNVYLHLFTDGKDSPKQEGSMLFGGLEENIGRNYPNIKIASVVGRNFAMERNGDWRKTRKAYDLLVKGDGNEFQSPAEYIKEHYQRDIFDDFIEPGLITGKEGRVKDNDAIIFFNFREDSVRQLTRAFVDDNFTHFPQKKLNNVVFVAMTEYDKSIPCFNVPGTAGGQTPIQANNQRCFAAFQSAEIKQSLPEIVSENGLKQLHVAESEKYAHVTYFLNGGTEDPFDGEDRVLVPSPSMDYYNKTPAMSADKITEKIIENINHYDFIVANFANPDTVGHSGDFEATVRAIESVDSSVGKVMEGVLKSGGVMIVTADHGNAEEKIYKFSGEKKTEHSVNPVPFYLIGDDFRKKSLANEEEIKKQYQNALGTLTDVAPTVLELLGIKKPAEMTGESLLEKIIINLTR